ncbi:PGN_0703 family putative restriction endonuclease [Methylobacterium sp. HMF5984]|uniref:PGN_0703 family putative restriction endonuclease n=1 Tax=Methylobacterium sp. HMF5984 TaxID=3367370 RepID=UPI003854ACA0
MDATIPLPPLADASGLHDTHGILADTARAILDPSGLGAPPPHLPLIPEVARRRRHVFVPTDHRFKAAARFLQALWREDRGLPIGTHMDRANPHRLRRLGSRISIAAGRTGANFMTPDIAAVAARALTYREAGAAYDIGRLRTNLLSSQPLAFNLFGPLAADTALATRFMAELFPGTLAEVTDILFEHSPGRGDPRFTADRTALDVVIRGRSPTGARALICIEMKYSEAGHEPAPPPHPRHAEIARATPGLFIAPSDPALTGSACQQLYRQHCLASAMLTAGVADTATLTFIAPAHNQLAHAAAATYNCQLTDPQAGPIPFIPLTLEHTFAALAKAGQPEHARALHRRYTDWWLLDGELELAMAATMADAPMPDIAPVSPAPTDAPFVANPAPRKRPQRARPTSRTRAAA